jgi:hypothetical protein
MDFPRAVRNVLHVTGRAWPSVRATAAAGRPRGPGSREIWGYGVWLFAGLVFGIPESWAGLATPPWPSLSNTVAHLEQLWSPTAVIIVALIVFLVFQAVRYPPGHTGEFAAPPGAPRRGRTPGGRLTQAPAAVSPVPVLVYFPLALGVIAAGATVAAVTGAGAYVLGYVIYGLFAVFCVAIPNALAYWFARDVPFPTFFRTITDLERRWRPAAIVIVAGLVVLMLHLVFFPRPDIPH